MTLFAEVRHGSSAKIPLVLLHGFGGIGALWAPVIRRLDPDLPLFVYDLPGHGQSLDAEGAGRAGAMARAIVADLSARGLASFHLCGHSMGGAIACLIALKARDRVHSLTLAAPGGFGFEINHTTLRSYALAIDQGGLATAFSAMMAEAQAADRRAVEHLVTARQTPRATERLLAILQAFLVEREGRTGQGTLPLDALADLGLATRLLWGDADPVLPATQARAIWPGAKTVLVPGAGHMLIEEAPDSLAAAIMAAVREAEG